MEKNNCYIILKDHLKNLVICWIFLHILLSRRKIDTELLQWKYINNPFVRQGLLCFRFRNESTLWLLLLFPKNITCNSKGYDNAIVEI
jgi:hypothetical protein